MNDDLEVVFSAKNEIEATLIMNALTDAGLRAMTQGQHISSFRAENPVDVKVVVQRPDLDAAKLVLKNLKIDEKVDWDQVDVGEPSE